MEIIFSLAIAPELMRLVGGGLRFLQGPQHESERSARTHRRRAIHFVAERARQRQAPRLTATVVLTEPPLPLATATRSSRLDGLAFRSCKKGCGGIRFPRFVWQRIKKRRYSSSTRSAVAFLVFFPDPQGQDRCGTISRHPRRFRRPASAWTGQYDTANLSDGADAGARFARATEGKMLRLVARRSGSAGGQQRRSDWGAWATEEKSGCGAPEEADARPADN